MARLEEMACIDLMESSQNEQPCAGIVLSLKGHTVSDDPLSQKTCNLNEKIIDLYEGNNDDDLDQLIETLEEDSDDDSGSHVSFDGIGDESEDVTKPSIPRLRKVDLGHGYDNRSGKKKVIRTSTPLQLETEKFKTVKCGNSEFQIPGDATLYYDESAKISDNKSSNENQSNNSAGVSGGVGGGFLHLAAAWLKGKFLRIHNSSKKDGQLIKIEDVRIAIIEIKKPTSQLKTNEFKVALDDLVKAITTTTNPTTDIVGDFFDDWGTHMVIQQDLGIIVETEYISKDETDNSKFSTGLEATNGGALAGGEARASVDFTLEKNKTDAASKKVMLLKGGNRIFKNSEELMKYAESNPSGLENRIQLFPYYQFLKAGSTERATLKRITEKSCGCKQEGETKVEMEVQTKKRKK